MCCPSGAPRADLAEASSVVRQSSPVQLLATRSLARAAVVSRTAQPTRAALRLRDELRAASPARAAARVLPTSAWQGLPSTSREATPRLARPGWRRAWRLEGDPSGPFREPLNGWRWRRPCATEDAREQAASRAHSALRPGRMPRGVGSTGSRRRARSGRAIAAPGQGRSAPAWARRQGRRFATHSRLSA